ncbi:MAG TPA: septum formation protein Maf [Bdellovibrionales bacterium]|nr:MAG: septum formation protein Maf [Bdellovibrionales bacterium GWB1_52_6]OFZ05505.1 MAG: septum formation protein Maf [Bdellovibrionales bacterium GWA1_52_35]OFZ42194.1 MAG: septum formation protein Maf [Bdellovibrionales bacterium GWC1_52_8]HAR41543.1 septum formation protein Maf [Bdellovibrionales bacterium]HCM39129.1 septum formation protein Maf [Bdellovibrionales bacterium]
MKTILVLASSSPRRIDLLRQMGLDPQVLSPEVDESALPREKPAALVERLARLKAESVISPASRKFGSCIIIAADTIVVAPNRRDIFGKPENTSDAARMLRILQGQTHTVLTGYCIIGVKLDRKRDKGELQELSRVVTSKVTFRSLNSKDIQNYIRSREPMDKAGAYAAQGLGTSLIESIQGSYTNVVGLPVSELLTDLEHQFKIQLFGWLR